MRAVYDCAERQDTGYVDGEPYVITVVTVDGHPVERDTANAYIVMQDAAAADGVGLRIVSGFRTNAEQQELYDCFINCNCNDCNQAARPGYNNHQSGHALDLNTATGGVYDWLNAHGGHFGFSETVAGEPWHWEWWGGGPGGGPCAALPCNAMPAGGDILDDGGPCFRANGPSEYWRRVDGAGHGGSLHWTNAFVSGEPGNWGRWLVNLEQGGEYQVEVLTGGAYGLWPRTRYAVGHAGASETVTIDQSAVEGWQSLGVFAFAAGGEQWVDVYDNYDGDVPSEQHILADAVRLTPWVAPPDPDAWIVPPPPPDAGAPRDDASGPLPDGDADTPPEDDGRPGAVCPLAGCRRGGGGPSGCRRGLVHRAGRR